MAADTPNASPEGMAGPACWCGNRRLEEFGAGYLHCAECETLVFAHSPGRKLEDVNDEPGDYYGNSYWFERQETEFGDPPLPVRAREDLSRRSVHWLRTLLRYRRPPGRALELGCGHGGFTALLQWAGFEARGVELSPAVARWAGEHFGVSVLTGPVERQRIEPGSLDVIVLLDVLEHLPDPAATLRHCATLLAPDGLLVIQTPAYPERASRQELETAHSPFLKMMLPVAHLNLFSRRSASRLMSELGFGSVAFEAPYFPQYDMFFVASRGPLEKGGDAQIADALLAAPPGRLTLALLDLDQARLDSETRYFMADADRTGRGAILVDLEAQLQRALEEKRGLESQLAARPPDPEPAVEEPPPAPPLWRDPLAASQLRRLLVDLTPMLPGGENGGAKPLTLEIIRALARIRPEMEIHLLHNKCVEQELKALGIPGVRLYCLDATRQESENALSKPVWYRFRELLEKRVAPRVPLWLRRRLRRPYEAVVELTPVDPLPRWLKADLLFCPFTGPFFHTPLTPTVCLVHDLQFKAYPEFFTGEARAERERHFQLACRCARRVVTVSEFVRRDVIAQSGLDPNRVVAIPNAIQARLAPAPPVIASQILTRYGLVAEEYLLYPANFWPHKNHRMLLTAFALYRHKHPESVLKLVLTGQPGPLRDGIAAAVRAMGLERHVILPGFLPETDFATLMSFCAAVIFPSLYEGFGIPLVEAMAAGRPVLSSDRTSLPEVAGGGVRFFDPRRPGAIVAAIEELVSDPAKIRSLTGRGPAQLKRVGDSIVMAYRYLEVFLAALGEPFVFEDNLQGMWGDGWCGEYLILTYAPSDGPVNLELSLTCPEWFPVREAGVHICPAGGANPHVVMATSGERTDVSTPLDPAGGVVELYFTPTVSPKELNHSGDTRRLSCFLHQCSLRGPAGARALWPVEEEKRDAE